MDFSISALSEMLSNAERNVARVSDPVRMACLRKLADTSDRRFFSALVDVTMRQDSHWRGYAFETTPGSQWRCRVIEARLEALRPFMESMYEVATYGAVDRKRMLRVAGMPQRYKHNFARCVDYARIAIGIVDSGHASGLTAFFAQYVRLEDGKHQPEAQKALIDTFRGLGSDQADALVRQLGLYRCVSPPGVLVLQRLGVVSGGSLLRLPSERERSEAAVFYEKVAVATEKPYGYVEAIFASNFVWSLLDNIRWPGRRGTCIGDGPECNVCAHASYCRKSGVAEPPDTRVGWLCQYPAFYDQLAASDSVLGRLPRAAREAVLLALRHENATFWRAPVGLPIEAKLLPVRASLADVTVDALRAALARAASDSLPEHEPLEACLPETWSVAEFVGRGVPCLLESPPGMRLAGEGRELLAEYVRRGHTTVPLLAVNWRDVADTMANDGLSTSKTYPDSGTGELNPYSLDRH
ncbi:hypothetical protein BJG93_00645 [Paraburkholderia sprentiae WSM5005]|uniref:Uncharacterized protein n=1 Tax=Paraburkholderia sprentiae WSM5005 TaxID=754502 RepID=A0A1I9YCP2_9BURK|nr:hypothetical protein [Paraburkholderia sprentiae]APA84075.2 hypothetical protein BJG93_00645 [Paraburkholderia sprentiae WSM5005]